MRAGVAINPHTPFEMIREVLGDLDRVLVMTVNPGFGGQKLIQSVLPKIQQIADAAKAMGRSIEIGVDGGVDQVTTPKVLACGANVLVAGSSVFQASGGIAAGVKTLRAAG